MIRLKLLGGFDLTGIDSAALPTRKAVALVAYLALSAGHPQRRDKLAALLWPDRGDAQARHSLAQTLYVIRRAFGDAGRDALAADARSVTLDPTMIDVDVIRLQAIAAVDGPDLAEITSVYHGTFLEGFSVASESFEDWLVEERQRLHGLALDGLHRLLQQRIDGNDDHGAIATARRLLALDSLQETVHRALMQLFAQTGQRDAMVRQFKSCSAVLRHELDVAPAPETQRLYEELLTPRPAVERKGLAVAPTFRRVPIAASAMSDAWRWIQLPYVGLSWHADETAVVESGYWTKTMETLSAFVVRKRAAFKAANTDYTRVVVPPPSQVWPNCSAVPGRVSHPGLF